MIDLGSNSFRLVVFMAGEGWWKRTDEIYEAVRIGEGLAATGKLGKQPMERALATKVMTTMRKRRINGRAKNSDATGG